jgi:sporulation protein YlmC with PRC-barrel domain
MKLSHIVILFGITLIAPAISHAQVAGSTVVAVSVAEMRDITLGWSAKRQILGQAVYNDNNERVGSVDDIIVTGDKAVSYAIVNAGGFLAVAKHDVVVPVSAFKLIDDKLVLAGATREALRATPRFEYTH